MRKNLCLLKTNLNSYFNTLPKIAVMVFIFAILSTPPILATLAQTYDIGIKNSRIILFGVLYKIGLTTAIFYYTSRKLLKNIEYGIIPKLLLNGFSKLEILISEYLVWTILLFVQGIGHSAIYTLALVITKTELIDGIWNTIYFFISYFFLIPFICLLFFTFVSWLSFRKGENNKKYEIYLTIYLLIGIIVTTIFFTTESVGKYFEWVIVWFPILGLLFSTPHTSLITDNIHYWILLLNIAYLLIIFIWIIQTAKYKKWYFVAGKPPNNVF